MRQSEHKTSSNFITKRAYSWPLCAAASIAAVNRWETLDIPSELSNPRVGGSRILQSRCESPPLLDSLVPKKGQEHCIISDRDCNTIAHAISAYAATSPGDISGSFNATCSVSRQYLTSLETWRKLRIAVTSLWINWNCDLLSKATTQDFTYLSSFLASLNAFIAISSGSKSLLLLPPPSPFLPAPPSFSSSNSKSLIMTLMMLLSML